MSLPFEGFGSLQPPPSPFSPNGVLGPLVDPILSLHRHHPLPDAGPWPVNEPAALHLALALREVQWLESPKGQQAVRHVAQEPQDDAPSVPRTRADGLQPTSSRICMVFSRFPKLRCRPALSHPDLPHLNNILVSNDNPRDMSPRSSTGSSTHRFSSRCGRRITSPPKIKDSG